MGRMTAARKLGSIIIDAQEFEDLTLFMSLAQVGDLYRRVRNAYNNGDLEFLQGLPFIHKVYPHRPKRYSRAAIPKDVRKDVLAVGFCFACGTTEKLTVDHIRPVSRGGSDARENLQPLCRPCNSRKGKRWDG